jgi:excinuclease ABC subunit C
MTDTRLPDRFSEEQATYTVRGSDMPDLEQGVAVLKAQLLTLPMRPGVYRMIDARGDVLYVGKARSLKARVTSYTQIARLPNRLLRMVSQTRSMVIVTTNTEAEALLLEANLIKRFRPPYNVLLRDDKSFPHILLRDDHEWPQLNKHRGARKEKGVYFGPFASAGAVNRTLNALQKLFLLRSCSDSYFQNRSRPCLLYQIKRCSAPCVGRITSDAYETLVAQAKSFLGGRSTDVQTQLSERMQSAADAMDFESAAVYRDRLRALSQIQSHQAINSDAAGDADVIALAAKGGVSCVQVFFVRGGQNWGNRAFFPRHDRSEAEADILFAFLSQFYEDKEPPRRLLLDRTLPDADLLAEALSIKMGRKISVEAPQRGQLRPLVETAIRNAAEALDRRLAESASQVRHLAAIAEAFDLSEPPQRIEVYDNSHIQGAHAVGAMIVAGPEGFRKSAYRKFNMKSADLTPGDDFAMMREVLGRRFSRLQAEDPERSTNDWPDLLLIDGGRGQLNAVLEILAERGVDDVAVVGVAKGPDRNAGREIFHLADERELSLEPGSAALFFLQRLRDEAHRFAIGAHRAKRSKDLARNPLDEIPGVGPMRKRSLLHHFGSARGVARAGIEDLQRVEGVSEALARAIYGHFHPSE